VRGDSTEALRANFSSNESVIPLQDGEGNNDPRQVSLLLLRTIVTKLHVFLIDLRPHVGDKVGHLKRHVTLAVMLNDKHENHGQQCNNERNEPEFQCHRSLAIPRKRTSS
jgi:hypothetical protein